jgi:hypothetical protein
MLEDTSVILSLSFLFLSFFLLATFLSLVLCQTHSFLMEFQNASYIERERIRETPLRTHTLDEHFYNSLSFFFFFILLLQQLFSPSFNTTVGYPSFSKYTYTTLHIWKKNPVFHIRKFNSLFVDLVLIKYYVPLFICSYKYKRYIP